MEDDRRTWNEAEERTRPEKRRKELKRAFYPAPTKLQLYALFPVYPKPPTSLLAGGIFKTIWKKGSEA